MGPQPTNHQNHKWAHSPHNVFPPTIEDTQPTPIAPHIDIYPLSRDRTTPYTVRSRKGTSCLVHETRIQVEKITQQRFYCCFIHNLVANTLPLTIPSPILTTCTCSKKHSKNSHCKIASFRPPSFSFQNLTF